MRPAGGARVREREAQRRRQEVVLMVGIAGSGKTTLARSGYPGHVHVSLDVITRDFDRRCELARLYSARGYADAGLSGNRRAEYVLIDDALAAGRSVVVDDTNLTAEIRGAHIEHARAYGAVVRAVCFRDAARAYRQNAQRAGGERVPRPILGRQEAEMEPPSAGEGYASIRNIW